MFRVSQEIRLNTSGSAEVVRYCNNTNADSENDCIFGKYQRTPDADAYPTESPLVLVAPELTDPSRVQLLHLPNGAVRVNSEVDFIIKRNGVKGNFEVKIESPSGINNVMPLQILDPERLNVNFFLSEAGLYKVHIKCNSVPLPKSPFIIISICGEAESSARKMELPVFKSDASCVTHRGIGLTHISLDEKNEFTVDGSAAGNNMLFVGIFGPKGQCDEVVIKHTGNNIYKITYEVRDPGDYLLVAKWGDEHIPGSPFQLSAI
ncbi:filamin-A [Anastrepha ludens]|uniref:filamin-A n=1 Tax=Anastrepha ludens TaxID=28586 RepID=UPI0023B120E5|nr:filamin-A [Anastrepha ludens]XP_053946585.1 filamin-A [Anastrepha ludens]XP_053946586.1 filamin-A [Anastrepha ludens]XP_053946587.1 filamin-A [Anastrepha ludens]